MGRWGADGFGGVAIVTINCLLCRDSVGCNDGARATFVLAGLPLGAIA